MTGFLQFSRCFPQINGCGDSAHFPPLEDALVSLALLTRKRVGCDTMKSGDRRRYLMVIHTFRQLGQTSSTVSGWCLSSDSCYSQNFCRFLLSSSGDIQAQRRTRFFSTGRGGDQVRWHGEMSWFFHFIAFKTLNFCWRFWCLFFLSEWQIPLVGILTGQMMFRTNEISVLSLLRFYLQ